MRWSGLQGGSWGIWWDKGDGEWGQLMWLYDFLIFYNSGKAILGGVSPYYTIFDFNSPIFLALFFAPFSLLPVGVSYSIFIIANLLLA